MHWYFKLLIGVVYFAVIGWLKLAFNPVWFVAGGIVSSLLMTADRLLYVFWLRPFDQISIQVQQVFKEKQYVSALLLLFTRSGEQGRLFTKSLLFALIWPVIFLFILTSTNSIGTLGIMMGLGLGLVVSLLEDWYDYRKLRRWFCWQIKREMSEKEVRFTAGGFIVVFIIFTLMLVLN